MGKNYKVLENIRKMFDFSCRKFKSLIKHLVIVSIIIISVFLLIEGVTRLKVEIEKNSGMWVNIIEVYIGISLLTFIPILNSILFGEVILHNKIDFQDSKFIDENKEKLELINERMRGTLIFWKNKVRIYKNLHYYSVIWSTLISVVMPILIQLTNSDGKLLITIISTHSALLIAFHKGFKIESNYKRYRICESNFYDAYREMLHYSGSDPGETEKKIQEYVKIVEATRKDGREIEIDNIPNADYSDLVKKRKNG